MAPGRRPAAVVAALLGVGLVACGSRPTTISPAGSRTPAPVPTSPTRASSPAAGVLPVVKHFPGLGGASGNTEVGAAATLPWNRERAEGLVPFRAAVRAGAAAVMVANAAVPGLTRVPAGLSGAVIAGELRGRLGFTGLVLTDSLSAGAVAAAGYSVPRAAVAAFAAGADMVLFNAAAQAVSTVFRQTVQAIAAAVATGSLPADRLRDAVQHVLAAKRAALCR